MQESLARNVPLHSQAAVNLLGRGRRDRQQNLLLSRDTSASTPSREQPLDNPFCRGLEQGLAGEVWTLVPPPTGQL